MSRLRQVGFTDKQMAALDDPETLDAEDDRAVVEFARTVTVDPALATDQDFARLRQSFDDKKIAEIVYLASQAAFFNRLTETARLPLALDAPRPTPLTRPELKALIEDVKSRTPRVPLPELSEQDREHLRRPGGELRGETAVPLPRRRCWRFTEAAGLSLED